MLVDGSLKFSPILHHATRAGISILGTGVPSPSEDTYTGS
jgi:hypothetical protein